jgi:CRISPR-associated protein (TIGR02710 family)
MSEKIKAMISSVGTTPEACASSIIKYAPEYILFFVSEATREKIPEIKRMVESQKGNWPVFIDIAETIDFEDITACYLTLVEEEARWRGKYKILPEEIIIDYTGGSKVMTAALVLYGVNYFDNFSYTGGPERGDGGRVVTGSEELKRSKNPLDATILSKRQLWHTYSKSARYEIISTEALRYSKSTGDERNRKFCQIISRIYKVLSCYDRFDFDRKFSFIEDYEYAIKELSVFYKALKSEPLEEWHNGLEKLASHFKRLKSDPDKKYEEWVLALIANAKRRADLENKYEEAVACLYNALERIEQMLVRKCYNADPDNFPPDKVPESLKGNFKKYHKDEKRYYKIGLDIGMQLLKAKEVAEGIRFIKDSSIWRNDSKTGLLDIRNKSIRGHGFNPIGEDEFKRWWTEIHNLWNYEEQDLPVIPNLPEIWW